MIIGIGGVLIIVVITLIVLKVIPAKSHTVVSGVAKVLSGSFATNAISSSSPVPSESSSENAAVNSSFPPTTSPAQASSAVMYKQYTNARYGFFIDYPANLKAGQEPEDGDGRSFSSDDSSIKLHVSGTNNAMDYTAASYLKDLLTQHPSAAYHEYKDNWCIISWTDGSSIIYWKAVVGTSSINEYQIVYPVKQKDKFDAVISHISSTFKTPGIDDFH